MIDRTLESTSNSSTKNGAGSAAGRLADCVGTLASPVRQLNEWAQEQLDAFLSGMQQAARLVHDLEKLSRFAVEFALCRLNSQRGSLMVLDDRRLLRILAARGLPDWVVGHTAIALGQGVAGRVASIGRPVLVSETKGLIARGEPNKHGRYRSDTFISVPVPADRQIVGVVNVTDPLREAPFQNGDLEQLVNIADSIGVAIHRAVRYREAEELAVRDELTGLFNRRYLFEFLSSILDRAREESFPVTLLIFDIDHFKRYNDQYGHSAGDEVLREVARLMRDNFRSHDVVCRLGGEEFAVILWDGRGEQTGSGWQGYPTAAFEFAERLRKATMQHRFRATNNSGLTLSGGLATFPWDAVTRQELMDRADAALYRAKRDGRNRIYLCGEIRTP